MKNIIHFAIALTVIPNMYANKEAALQSNDTIMPILIKDLSPREQSKYLLELQEALNAITFEDIDDLDGVVEIMNPEAVKSIQENLSNCLRLVNLLVRDVQLGKKSSDEVKDLVKFIKKKTENQGDLTVEILRHLVIQYFSLSPQDIKTFLSSKK